MLLQENVLIDFYRSFSYYHYYLYDNDYLFFIRKMKCRIIPVSSDLKIKFESKLSKRQCSKIILLHYLDFSTQSWTNNIFMESNNLSILWIWRREDNTLLLEDFSWNWSMCARICACVRDNWKLNWNVIR